MHQNHINYRKNNGFNVQCIQHISIHLLVPDMINLLYCEY